MAKTTPPDNTGSTILWDFGEAGTLLSPPAPATTMFGTPVPVRTIPGQRTPDATSEDSSPGSTHTVRSGPPAWLVTLVGGAMALVLCAVLVAVTVPAFLDRWAQAQWRATRIAVPDAFRGARATSTDQLAQLTAQVRSQGFSTADSALYRYAGKGQIAVVAARSIEPRSISEQTAARVAAMDTLQGLGGPAVAMHRREAGDLGGWLGCGTETRQQVSICMATDASSLVVVVVTGSLGDSTTLTRQLRESSVQRP